MPRIILLALAALLGACASPPMGPSVMVLPARGVPFEQFQQDDRGCREWALHQSAASDQRQYDFAYQQCMYARGHVIPGVQPIPPR